MANSLEESENRSRLEEGDDRIKLWEQRETFRIGEFNIRTGLSIKSL